MDDVANNDIVVDALLTPQERSKKNLRPAWVKGQSGNPRGRPIKRVLSDRYQELMESRLPREVAIAMKLPFGALWADALALVSARTALKSTETGILQRKEIREACEGKAVARVEVFSDETIDINVSFEDTSKLLSHKHAERIIDVEQPEELPESTSKELPDDGDVEE